MDKPLLRAVLIASTLALAACGNKGPLVRMTDQPPPVPVEEAVPLQQTLPDTTPPEQPPATDALPPPAGTQEGDDVPPPPAGGDDGG